eukprot:Unigene7990_Nuclearia_a/m.24522 Unigene7990_Nuclearia_a/g.24522  ORF Unigene7990_Nuclearia_a/g.24522 Unigene7990_Nuclearia_a/m.24522 type:complete len:329 (-) Unigene7990_Nuclearia_a:43-1029(-)
MAQTEAIERERSPAAASPATDKAAVEPVPEDTTGAGPVDGLHEVWDHFGDQPGRGTVVAASVVSAAPPELVLDTWPASAAVGSVPAHLNMLAPAPDVRAREVRRTAQLERVATTNELMQATVHNNLVLSQYDKAIQLLLETPSNTAGYRADALKACLIAAIKAPANLEHTLQVVATSLIANNELLEGVQLLCLLGRGLEACTYLQNNGLWRDAAVMAKSSLSAREAHVVNMRWAQHLRQNGEYEKALRQYLSLGAFASARQLLLDQKHYERAVLLTTACEELGVVLNDLSDDHGRAVTASMYVGYASYLYDLGLWTGAKVYREKAQSV